jgi:IS4 transposase
MWVKTEKAVIRQWIREIEQLKKENKELRESNETQYELIKKLLKENEKLKILNNNI